jgi:hypothetical protein
MLMASAFVRWFHWINNHFFYSSRIILLEGMGVVESGPWRSLT